MRVEVQHVSQESDMRDVYEVLRAKEILIEELRQEIEALRLVAPLLNDGTDTGSLADTPGNPSESDAQSVRLIGRRGRARLRKESDGGRTAVTDDAETVGTTERISGRLRRLARPVLDAVNSMAS
jgi:hypothetical protein